MVYIYVLQLVNNKYYIGKTNNPRFRLKNHFTSNGSAWTKKYKPLKVLEVKSGCDTYDEDKYTLKYMEKYGIDNVRGGSFCRINLTKENRSTIQKMIKGASDRCYKCGEEGHYANECLFDSDEEEIYLKDEIISECDKMDKDNKKIERLKNWCEEMIKDHHTIYLLDRIGNNYYYYNERQICCEQFSYQRSKRKTKKPSIIFNIINFDTFEKVLKGEEMKRRIGPSGINKVYEDKDFKVLITNNIQLKRPQRDMINKSISEMILYNRFVYVEF
ncbi:MAG: GIY-YIG nuclease family protein [Magnetovibrio sp.]|nr:GIY-YIG nuclease family protein [Magnetovibrio sp.]